MGLLGWIIGNNVDRENQIVVKTLKSKGNPAQRIPITVGDIKKGLAVDNSGYPNEVVLFLRLNKKDR